MLTEKTIALALMLALGALTAAGALALMARIAGDRNLERTLRYGSQHAHPQVEARENWARKVGSAHTNF